MNYSIMPMDHSHIDSIAELERKNFTAPWSEKMLAEELYNDTASFLVAQGADGTLMGYAGLHVVLDEGYIANIVVQENVRRQGIAGELLSAYLRFGKANLAFLTLEVRASNVPAMALYEKYGFVEAGRRPNYYNTPTEDALLMTKTFAEEEKSL